MGERGCDEEGEDEGRESPERPVKVGRGREVGGSVGRRKGVECVDTAKDDLDGASSIFRSNMEEEETNSFGINVKMVLIIVYVPEGRVASVRDVACSTDVQ